MRYIAIYLVVLAASTQARADTLYWLNAKLPNGATYDDGGGDPMKFWVDETQGSPGGLPVGNVEQEVIAAYQLWQDVNCAYIGFKFQGAITDPNQIGIHADTKNVMAGFVESTSDPRYADDLGSSAAVGVALTYKSNGIILGCDTVYNAVDYQFGDNLPVQYMDFPSLANHEQGHCMGLDHDPYDLTSVMYPNVHNGDNRRTLDAHDIDNVCQLYPETGSLGSPCAGTSCGSGFTCIADPVNGGNFCSQGCDPQNTSACSAADGGVTGFGCRTSSAIGGFSGACFPGQGDFSPDIGGACTQQTDCKSTNAFCLDEITDGWPAGYCSQLCDSSVCPAGNYCTQLIADPTHFYCTSECTTYSGGCRDGYACYPYDAAGDGYCYPTCTSDADCYSWKCLPDGVCYPPGNGGSWVGHACISGGDCPTGDFCVPEVYAGTNTGWKGGYCIGTCGAGQNALRTCDPGSVCVVDGAEGQAYCLQSCDANGGCRSGYSCAQKPGLDQSQNPVCVPGAACTSNNDCPVGDICSDGSCVGPPMPDAGCVLCGDGGVATTGGSGGSTGTGDTPVAPSGCGCGSGSGSALDLCGLALLALALHRRRAW